jgi:DNA adenine methylase
VETTDLGDLFEELERNTEPASRDTIIKAPFPYPGGKSRSIKNICSHLPYTDKYVSVFGGSGCDILARRPVKLEVFNDRYAGVTSFYRCLRNPKLFDALVQWLELTVHSREEFVACRDTWQDTSDDVERAAKWYYMTSYSFASLGRNWGRALATRGIIGNKIRKKLTTFDAIHQRFRNVQIENQDWSDCLHDYDSPDCIFYLDPPYVDADTGIYKVGMSHDDHRRMIDIIFSLKGFVALSGYANPLYDNQDWDAKHTWKSYVSIQSGGHHGNKKEHLAGQIEYSHAEEVLWIKDAR